MAAPAPLVGLLLLLPLLGKGAEAHGAIGAPHNMVAVGGQPQGVPSSADYRAAMHQSTASFESTETTKFVVIGERRVGALWLLEGTRELADCPDIRHRGEIMLFNQMYNDGLFRDEAFADGQNGVNLAMYMMLADFSMYAKRLTDVWANLTMPVSMHYKDVAPPRASGFVLHYDQLFNAGDATKPLKGWARLFAWFKQNKVKVVHMVRLNELERMLSMADMNRGGVSQSWVEYKHPTLHYRDGKWVLDTQKFGDVALGNNTPINLNVTKLHWEYRASMLRQARLNVLLKGMEVDYKVVHYEELAEYATFDTMMNTPAIGLSERINATTFIEANKQAELATTTPSPAPDNVTSATGANPTTPGTSTDRPTTPLSPIGQQIHAAMQIADPNLRDAKLKQLREQHKEMYTSRTSNPVANAKKRATTAFRQLHEFLGLQCKRGRFKARHDKMQKLHRTHPQGPASNEHLDPKDERAPRICKDRIENWAEVAEELKGTVALSMCEHNNTVPGTDVHSWFERWILEKYGKEAGMGQGA